MNLNKLLIPVFAFGILMSCSKKNESTPSPEPESNNVKDIDGNVYNTVKIGNQIWMKENLKVSKYRNGDVIPNHSKLSVVDWQSTTFGAYAIYDNDSVNDANFGKLYNFYTVSDPRGLCPTGWHVPTDHDWNLLIKYLDSGADTSAKEPTSITAGGSMKAVSSFWLSPNSGASNSSGFTGLPGGYRVEGFSGKGFAGHWWSSTYYSNSNVWGIYLSFNNSNSNRGNAYYKSYGFSVRCLKD